MPHLYRLARCFVTGAALFWTLLSLPSSAALLLKLHSFPNPSHSGHWTGLNALPTTRSFEHVLLLPGDPTDDPFLGILVSGSFHPVPSPSTLHSILAGSWLCRLRNSTLLAGGLQIFLIEIRSSRRPPAGLPVAETAEASTWILFASGLLLMALARISKRQP